MVRKVKNKKIMLISNKDNNFYNFRSELILKLKELGNEVILVCPYGKKIDYFIDRECRFIDIGVDRRGTNIFTDLRLINAYDSLINYERPDVVLTYTTKCSIYGGIVCRKYKIPYIINNAGLIELDGKRKWLEFILNILYMKGFGHAACMMYQNTHERDVVNKLLHNRVHFRDIPGSGVNLEQFQYTEYPNSDEEIIFNYVARIVEIKGISEYLHCAARIKKMHPKCHFLIYGDYDDEKYRPVINKLISKGIIEYGGLQMDMIPCIAKAHAVIHPSHYEGMTNVILEHSAMGRPCIASDIPGCKEGIDDGKTGYLFNARAVDELEKVVERFIKLDHYSKEAMGRAARKKMEKEFDRNIVTNIYFEEIYRALGAKS